MQATHSPPSTALKPASTKGTCAQFLRYNPRFINEPICQVLPTENSPSVADCMQWRNESPQVPNLAPHSLDSTSRSDYQPHPPELRPRPLKKHHPTAPPAGIAPLINDSPAKVREGISFRHQYNSRTDPNEPIRGKLHGSFVWETESQDSTKCRKLPSEN